MPRRKEGIMETCKKEDRISDTLIFCGTNLQTYLCG
jgi:hypothetical protein